MPANILIVEDDPDILSSLAEAIREEGFVVETAANGYQALTRLESQLPDLIFLDLMMPLMDGWKFLEIGAPAASPTCTRRWCCSRRCTT